MSKTTSFSRKQRRLQMREAGMLKVKNSYNFFSGPRQAWYKKIREDGQQLHETNLNRFNDAIEEQIEAKMDRLQETWKELGYNATEIEMLHEAYTILVIKDPENLRADKKNAQQLMKDARASLSNR